MRPAFRLGLASARAVLWAAAVANVPIGETIDEVDSLRDVRGNARHLTEFRGRPVAAAFVGVDCPISNLNLPGLAELERRYREKNVAFAAVYAQAGDVVEAVAGHAYERGVGFLVVKDYGATLAASLGVERVPTVCVFDAEG